MAKRKAGSDQDSPHSKRQKRNNDLGSKSPVEDIKSPNDLRLLLAFEQDSGPHVRQKIQTFKLFLDSIAYGEENYDRSIKQELLLGYLRSQAPAEDAEEATYLAELIKTWHFATQSNAEGLYSSLVAVFALLLKTISSLIDFREYGNQICNTLVQDDQFKLFERGLSANKAKEHLISPCLRLLTEIVSFDGGHAAKAVYRQREVAFKRLETFLGMRKDFDNMEEPERRTRPSVRNNAIRYLLANLRLQSPSAKSSILAEGRIIHSLFEDIAEDSPTVILEILDALKKGVALDGVISQSVKARLFNAWALGRLATLYGYRESDGLLESDRNVQNSAHGFLLFLCTTPGHGVLHPRTKKSLSGVGASETELTFGDVHDSSLRHRQQEEANSTRVNATLTTFLQSLRPYASVRQSDLVLAVFRTLPEMIGSYFSKNKSFSFDPKLTATWVGYSSFLLATVQLPLHEALLHSRVDGGVPPPTDIIMESILPRPLTQKVMTRCLNQSSSLITLFGTRILNAAFEKLSTLLELCEDIQHHRTQDQISITWSQAASTLIVEFKERCPEMKHVIAQFRSCSKGNLMLREGLTRLLASYYKIVPQLAMEEKFDISVPLSIALQDFNVATENSQEDGMRLLELEHMLDIAYRSPNMEWWHKTDKMRLSPFTTLLKMYVDRRRTNPNLYRIKGLLKSIAKESHMLSVDISMSSLDVLTLSLQGTQDWQPSSIVFEFLDNCIRRLVKKPVYYQDFLDSRVAATRTDVTASKVYIDLLLIAILEQWRFLVESANTPTIANASMWLVRYIDMKTCNGDYICQTKDGGAANSFLSSIRDELKSKVNDEDCCAIFEMALKNPQETGASAELSAFHKAEGQRQTMEPVTETYQAPPSQLQDLVPLGPSEEDEDHPGLNRWTRKGVQDAIAEGAVGQLVLCLCSKHLEIRMQALTSVRAFARKLETSGYKEWQQTYLLAGEIAETANDIISDGPLPHFAWAIAARLFPVLADPLDFMYAKANKFLNKGPLWALTKLPSYWVDQLLLQQPTDDDTLYQEVEWLLDVLIDGLRTSADMDLYCRCHIFERLLSFATSDSTPSPCFEKTVTLLFRCTYVEGSTRLITRCGLMSWIAACASRPSKGTRRERLECLALRARDTCDQDRVNKWSNGALSSRVDSHGMPISV